MKAIKMLLSITTLLFCVTLFNPIVVAANVLGEGSFAHDGKTGLGNGVYAIQTGQISDLPLQLLKSISHEDTTTAELVYESKIVSGSRNVSEHVKASFEAEYDGGVVEGRVAGSTDYESEESASRIFLIVKVTHKSKTRRVIDATLKNEVVDAFKKNIKHALGSYGDSYISSIDYGASLCAIIEMTESSYAKKLSSGLNASGNSPTTSGSASVERTLNEAKAKSSVNITILSKGFEKPTIDSQNMDSLIKEINNMKAVSGDVPLLVNTTPISELILEKKDEINSIISAQIDQVKKYNNAVFKYDKYKRMICFRKDVKDLFTGHEVTDAEAHNWCTDSGTKLDKLEENLNNYQTYSSNTKNLPTDLPNDWKNPEFKTFTWDTGEASVANRKNYRVTGVWIKIKTSDDNHGGTDSTIHAGFKNLSPSNGWHLDKSEDHTDKFETGHWDRFKKTFDKAYSLNDFTRPGCEFWLKGTDMSDSDAWTIDKMRVYLEVSSWKVGEQGIYHLIYFRDQDKNITTSSKKYFIFNHSPGSFVDNSDWNDFIQ